MSEAGLPRLDPELEQQLKSMRSRGRSVHHVADLTTGTVHSEEVAGPLTASDRRTRLTAFGHLFDDLIFGQPMYRMSSRKTFQESPLAFTTLSTVTSFLTEIEEIVFTQPRNPTPDDKGFMVFHFDKVPAGKCLATFSVAGFPRANTTGAAITLQASGAQVSIPISGPFDKLIEIVFDPPGEGPADILLRIESNVQVLVFRWMTLGTPPLVFERL